MTFCEVVRYVFSFTRIYWNQTLTWASECNRRYLRSTEHHQNWRKKTWRNLKISDTSAIVYPITDTIWALSSYKYIPYTLCSYELCFWYLMLISLCDNVSNINYSIQMVADQVRWLILSLLLLFFSSFLLDICFSSRRLSYYLFDVFSRNITHREQGFVKEHYNNLASPYYMYPETVLVSIILGVETCDVLFYPIISLNSWTTIWCFWSWRLFVWTVKNVHIIMILS